MTLKPASIKFRLFVMSLLALAGLLLSVYLSKHFYDVRGGNAGFQSACNLSQTMNCDAVAASDYAELVKGIPLSSFAAGWYLALFVAVASSFRAGLRKDSVHFSFILTLFAAAMSVVYLGVMTFSLKTFCLYCLAVDAVNFAGLFVAWSLRRQEPGKSGFVKFRWAALSLMTLVSVAAMAEGLTLFDDWKISPAELNHKVNETLASPPVGAMPGDADAPVIGPKDAAVTIVEYGDFQCPSCRISAFMLHALMEKYPKDVRILFKNLPLDQSCDKYVKHQRHPFACEAARAGVCAQNQGKFEEYFKTIYEKQSQLEAGKPAEFARSAGADPALLEKCMNSPRTSETIDRDIEESQKLEIHGTPAFFVNGYRVDGPQPLSFWITLVDKLLEGAKQKGSHST